MARPTKSITRRWAALWTSRNLLDGETRHFLRDGGGLPELFKTRKDCRAWIRLHYGYIASRPDLRTEPHGWRVPRAVRVHVTIEEVRT